MEMERRESAPEIFKVPKSTYISMCIGGLDYSCQVTGESSLHIFSINGERVSGPDINVASRDKSGELVDGLIREGWDLFLSSEDNREQSPLGLVSTIYNVSKRRTA